MTCPKKILTAVGVEHIRAPREGHLEIFDRGYPGLALRVGHGGTKAFIQFYRFGGKQRRVTIGQWPRISLADARHAWREAREAIARGEDPERNNKRGGTANAFEVVLEEWLKRDAAPRNKPSSLYQLTKAIELDVLPAWRGRRVDEIAKRDVLALLDGIMDRGATVKARRVFAYLARFFRWCIERDILTVNPMAGLHRPGSEKSRERVLSDEDLAKVWRSADGIFGAATRLLMLTGARREEIGQLRWSEIDGDTITLSGARTKTGEPHTIPLSVAAQAVLAGVPRIAGCEFVFTTNGKKPIAAWAPFKSELDADCGVSDWVIHDLRRTVATGMQRLGVNLQTIEAVIGHSGGSRSGVVGVYQRHSFADEKRAALQRWSKHVRRIAVEPC